MIDGSGPAAPLSGGRPLTLQMASDTTTSAVSDHDRVSDTSTWFAGHATTEREQTFLQSLRVVACSWGFADLRPQDTSSRHEVIGLLVEVQVPLLTTSRRILRVCYDFDDAGLPTLQSEWTPFEYPFEGGPDAAAPDPEGGLWVTGVEAAPEQCGVWTATWFERQLRRPVKRREWDRPRRGGPGIVPGSTTKPALVRWVLEQPEQDLDSSGGFRWSWLRHLPPSREIHER